MSADAADADAGSAPGSGSTASVEDARRTSSAADTRARKRDLLACGALVAYFAAWHAPGAFGGLVYVAEDTLAYFASNRAVHHALFESGAFAWWDALPGLGQPRLANIQNGSFSPFTLLFYLWPPELVFRFYPFLLHACIAIGCYALFRARRAGTGAALLGALSFATLSGVTTHFQHPPVMETLVWLPVTLWAWERHRATGRARHAIFAGVTFALQCFGASPQYLVYNALLMSLWMGEGCWRRRANRREALHLLATAAGIAALGLCLASWQLLPFLELAGEGHRTLLHDTEGFRDLFRATPGEVLLALASEAYLFFDAPVLRHGAPYLANPQLAFVSLLFAAFALRAAPRPWAFALSASIFLLGMLGAAAGVTTLLGAVFPFADRLRAPYRMIVPAGFLLSWLAALGAHRLRARPGHWRHALVWGGTAWVAWLGWIQVRPLDLYTDASVYRVPEAIARAEPRIAADFARGGPLPLFSINAGLAAGVPVLLQREVLIPASFFEGYFASQFGSLSQGALLDRTIVSAALPLVNEDATLLRAYGLRSVVRMHDGALRAEPVDEPLPRFRYATRARVLADPSERWSFVQQGAWDPTTTVLLREPAPGPAPGRPAAGAIAVEFDGPGHQRLVAEGPGGWVVTSGLLSPGWQVQVGGVAAPPIQADLALRAVAVPAGRHEIEWRYRPEWLSQALLASLLAVLIGFGLARLARAGGCPASDRPTPTGS